MLYTVLAISLAITVLAIIVFTSILNIEGSIENENNRNDDLIDLCHKLLPKLYLLAAVLFFTLAVAFGAW